MTSFNEISLFFIKSIKDKDEIYSALDGTQVHVNSLFKKCFQFGLASFESASANDVIKLKIESVLDFLNDEMNTGHWSEIKITTRYAFSAASFLKTIIMLKTSSACNKSILQDALKVLDYGLLLGAPLQRNSSLLTDCASFLSQKISELDNVLSDTTIFATDKANSDETIGCQNVKYHKVDVLNCPSLEYFNEKYFKTQVPVKLTGCMSHWPALHKWLDLNYFLKIAGNRTVPIEIGSHYVDENWSQKLVTLREFIEKQFLGKADAIEYLAQHNLFEQIPELKDDIHLPEYCCLSKDYKEDIEPDINAWFGPKGTLSPLHYDPKNNILTQVFGTKQLVLFSPEDTELLYPYEDNMLSNTARVDPLKPDLGTYPLFSRAKPYECLLGPGEMLFIPEKWWHHVTALDKSFSVSFWWK